MQYLIYFLIIFISSIPVLGNSNIDQAEFFSSKSKYDSAVYFYTKEINILKNANKHSELAAAYLKRSHACQLLGKFRIALKGYRNAERLYEEQLDYDGLVITYTSYAELFRKTENFDKAEHYLSKAIPLLKNRDVTNATIAKYYNRKAAILNENDGNINEIIFYSKKVIALAKVTNNNNLEASGLNELGFVYEKQNNPICVDYYKKAYQLFLKKNDLVNTLNVLINLTRYYTAQQNYLKSLNYLDQAFLLYEGHDFPTISVKLYYFQYEALKHLGKYQEANNALSNYYNADKKIIEIEWNKSLKEIENKYDLELKNKEIETEKNKSIQLKIDAINKANQRNYISVISILLAIILIITISGYFKIKKLNQSLNSNLNQKEILLQEVHHRVKNNLTLLKSLLYLRGKASKDPNVVQVLKECQTRIQTMSLIHQNLYDVDDASKVNFKKFVTQLTLETLSLIGPKHKTINTKIETNNIVFEMGTAVFLGLILNEFITNSLKHGFKNIENTEIVIELNQSGSGYMLSYSDSGKGLPIEFDVAKSGGFGFKLINIMVNQIDGDLHYNENKNQFKIKFSL